jgi:hypothetical protein
MDYFLHTVLQFIYLSTWVVAAVWGLRYQARVYVWCIRHRLPILFEVTKDSLIWGGTLTAVSLVIVVLLKWFGWTVAGFWFCTSAPFTIIALTLMFINEPNFRLYDIFAGGIVIEPNIGERNE